MGALVPRRCCQIRDHGARRYPAADRQSQRDRTVGEVLPDA